MTALGHQQKPTVLDKFTEHCHIINSPSFWYVSSPLLSELTIFHEFAADMDNIIGDKLNHTRNVRTNWIQIIFISFLSSKTVWHNKYALLFVNEILDKENQLNTLATKLVHFYEVTMNLVSSGNILLLLSDTISSFLSHVIPKD